jgi:hypothetical protein
MADIHQSDYRPSNIPETSLAKSNHDLTTAISALQSEISALFKQSRAFAIMGTSAAPILKEMMVEQLPSTASRTEAQLALIEVNMVSIQQVFLPYSIMNDGRTLSEHVESNPSFLLGDGTQ